MEQDRVVKWPFEDPVALMEANLKCLKKHIQLMDKAIAVLCEDTSPKATIAGMLLGEIADSCGSLGALSELDKLRDGLVTARTIYLTLLNVCFVCAGGEEVAERAFRYAMQRVVRETSREIVLQNETISVLSSVALEGLTPQVRNAVTEFTTKRGREITKWTPENPYEQIAAIASRYGASIGSMLQLAAIVIYRNASEVAHGTAYGVFWSLAGTGFLTAQRASADGAEKIRRARNAKIGLIIFGINHCVNAMMRVLSREFRHKEWAICSRELISDLGARLDL